MRVTQTLLDYGFSFQIRVDPFVFYPGHVYDHRVYSDAINTGCGISNALCLSGTKLNLFRLFFIFSNRNV